MVRYIFTENRNHFKVIPILILEFVLVTSIVAQSWDWSSTTTLGYTGTIITSFPIDGVAAGLANAYTGKATGSTAGWWTPAGLADLTYGEVTLYTAPLYTQTEFTALSLATPVPFFAPRDSTSLPLPSLWGTVGFILARLETKNIERINNLAVSLGTFNDRFIVGVFTYARNLAPTFSLGMNLSILTQEIAEWRSSSWGIDLGVQVRPTKNNRVDIVLRHIYSSPLKLNEINEKIPLSLNTGINWFFFRQRLQLCTDLKVMNLFSGENQEIFYALGLEYRVTGPIYIRTGINHREFALGLGINWRAISFDYAMSFHPLGITHRVSITSRFGFIPSEEEKRLTALRRELKEEEIKSIRKIREEEQRYRSAIYRLEKIETVNNRLTQIERLIKENKFTLAQTELQRLEISDPENIEILRLKQVVAQKLSTENLQVEFLTAKKMYVQKEYTAAIQLTERIIQTNPDYIPVKIIYHLSRGFVNLNQDRYEEAKKEFIQVLSLDPKNEDATMMNERIETILESLKSK